MCGRAVRVALRGGESEAQWHWVRPESGIGSNEAFQSIAWYQLGDENRIKQFKSRTGITMKRQSHGSLRNLYKMKDGLNASGLEAGGALVMNNRRTRLVGV